MIEKAGPTATCAFWGKKIVFTRLYPSSLPISWLWAGHLFFIWPTRWRIGLWPYLIRQTSSFRFLPWIKIRVMNACVCLCLGVHVYLSIILCFLCILIISLTQVLKLLSTKSAQCRRCCCVNCTINNSYFSQQTLQDWTRDSAIHCTFIAFVVYTKQAAIIYQEMWAVCAFSVIYSEALQIGRCKRNLQCCLFCFWSYKFSLMIYF